MITVDDKITYDAVLGAMRAAVTEKGEDYLYRGPLSDKPTVCVYATEVDGELKPSCIVGHVLYRLGVPLESLFPYDAHDVFMLVGVLALDITRDALIALIRAQEVQDGAVDSYYTAENHSWGNALRAAEAVR